MTKSIHCYFHSDESGVHSLDMPCTSVDIFSSYGNLVPKDPGRFGKFSGRGMHFVLQTYDFDASAHISILGMRSFASLMSMESLICTPYGKNMPIYSLDLIKAFGKNTVLIEVYDTLVAPTDLSSMDSVKEHHSALKDKEMAPRWYDSLHLSPTCSKLGTEQSCRRLAFEMTGTYAGLFPDAAPCNPIDKNRRNSAYVEELTSRGGPAINTISKILGQQDTEELFREHIFCVKDRFDIPSEH